MNHPQPEGHVRQPLLDQAESPRRSRFAVWPLMVSWVALLSGCTAFNHEGDDAFVPATSLQPLPVRPRIAVVLGSGGPRGYAHIGVLRVLEESGIRPDVIVGSSVGAFIGAFWAAGYSAAQIDELSRQGGPLTVFDPSIFADRGWIKGERLQVYVNAGLKQRTIEQLPTRLVVVATRRSDKVPVYFTRGNVDVSVRPGATPASASAGMKARDIVRRARIEPEVSKADFLFHPDLDYWAGPRRHYFFSARSEGERHARERMPDLLIALDVQTKHSR